MFLLGFSIQFRKYLSFPSSLYDILVRNLIETMKKKKKKLQTWVTSPNFETEQYQQ